MLRSFEMERFFETPKMGRRSPSSLTNLYDLRRNELVGGLMTGMAVAGRSLKTEDRVAVWQRSIPRQQAP
jgi:hypothetical protein